MNPIKRIVFSAKSRLQIRGYLFLFGILLLLSLLLGVGKKQVLRFLGKAVVEKIYERNLPIAVYGRDLLLSGIFQPSGERKPGQIWDVENQVNQSEDKTDERTKLWEEQKPDFDEMMLEENRRFQEPEIEEEPIPIPGEQPIEVVPETVEQPALAEEGRRWEKKNTIDLEDYILYEKLLEAFYTVDPGTKASSTMLNAEKMMGMSMKINRDTEGPQILIYHTHSQEAFADSVKGDAETGIVGVGEKLTELLTDRYGYQVLHCREEFDKKGRDEAYTNALPVVQELMEENPSIQVVIDLHRDEMPEKTRLVTDVNGKPTARFMFFNGLSWSKKTGQISYLKNPYLAENLAFSFQLQVKAKEYFPGLTRKIYLKQYRYNMHLCPKTTLIELGAQNNTLEEAMNACEPLAELLDMVLQGE